MAGTTIVWFRRDLRVHDHPALASAARAGRVVPVFVLDDRLLGGRHASAARAAFMLGCVRELDGVLAARGARLVVRRGRPEDELPSLAAEAGADTVAWTSDVSPFALRRDRAVDAALRAAGVRTAPRGGNYCADISQPRTKAGGPVTVFTPFWRQWEQLERRRVLPAPRRIEPVPGIDAEALPLAPVLEDELPVPFCEPGESAARDAATAWLEGHHLDEYAERHDDLAGGTSGLSAYLRWGCISARELEHRARERATAGGAAFVRQLAWRDFYAHVLLRFPANLRLEYQSRYRDLAWDDDPALLAAWRKGRTGYPIVDAAMRQLAASGWMHNRARMVAGSFLTKDLHQNWRAGEAWFARLLLDGEPAQNNGNWQWIASTGVDPAPYFRRIFNPVLQQERFDPDGRYVRRWVPELLRVPGRRLARPWTMTAPEQADAGCVIGRDYPGPIVDHAIERRVALDRYRSTGQAGR